MNDALELISAEQKAKLVQIIRQIENPRNAMAVEKLISFHLSNAWWEYFLNSGTGAYHLVSNLAGSLCTWSQNYGGDDMNALDSTRTATSPLLEQAFDRLKEKAHLTIEMLEPVKEGFEQTVMNNFDLLGNPITDTTYTKPRGGKLNITATLDSSALKLEVAVSDDGNDYEFNIPAYTALSSSPFEQAFKLGT